MWRSGTIHVALAVCAVFLALPLAQSLVQGNDQHAMSWAPMPRSEPPMGEGMVSSATHVVSPTSGVGQVNGTLCLSSDRLWPGNDPSACDNGVGPVVAVFDPANGDVYVTNDGSNNVSVVSGASNTVVATVPVGSTPYGAAYDRANGDIYVTDFDSGALSIIGPVTITSTPTISSFTATPSTTSVGQTTTLTVVASGGTGTLSYVYAGLPHGCASANKASLSCTPSATGSYTVRVYANDTAGHSANATTFLTVTPALASVTLTPSSDTLQVGSSAVFAATPACTGGPCPSTVQYNWSATNSLGTVSPIHGSSTVFTAGGATGTDTIYVNASVGSKQVTALATVTISTTVLTGVSVSAASSSVTFGTTDALTASGVCSPAPCPGGVTFAWSLNNTLGTVAPTTGSSVTFTAGSAPGVVAVSVVATLGSASTTGGTSLQVLPAGSSPTISSVSLSPTSATVATGGTATFTATAVCNPSPCPSSGLTLVWSVSSNLGGASPTTGATTTFTAGSSAGTGTLTVTATLNGGTPRTAQATITVTSSSSSGGGGGGFLGLPGMEGYLLLAGLAAVIVAVVVALLLHKRKGLSTPAPSAAPPPATAPSVPADPAPTPPTNFDPTPPAVAPASPAASSPPLPAIPR